MSNRRWFGGILFLLLFVGSAVAIGAGAYHAGFVHGVAQHATPSVVYANGAGLWFFPFGLFLFPLFFFLLLAGLRFAAGGRRRFAHEGWSGPGPWGPRGPRGAIEEWHRNAHAGDGSPTAAGPPTADRSAGPGSNEPSTT